MRTAIGVVLLVSIASPAGAESWRLVWSDEFDYSGLPDREKWSYEEGFVRNNELQYYVPARKENSEVKDGLLVIRAKKERYANPRFRGEGGPAGRRRQREFAPNVIHANVHTAKYNHVKGNSKGAKITIDKPYDALHVYAIEWNKDRIDFFVDDKKYFTYENEGTGTDAWPFDSPHYLILNVAIGGSWGGQRGIDDTIFPQEMAIDYVRVYQKGDSR